MKILITAEASPTRQRMESVLRDDGHQIFAATGAQDALPLFLKEHPEMVMIDANLENGDSAALSRTIKQQDPGHFTPVVFMAPAMDEHTLEKFMWGHADDFIEHPDNPLVLRAKVLGMEHTLDLYSHLESFKTKAEHEITLARHMFDAVTRRQRQDVSHIDSWVWPAGHFSGDFLIHEQNCQGKLYAMLGDFTGHGLAAAVGAIPSSDAFFSRIEAGDDLGAIAAEINRKLYHMLPTGHFCSACLLEVDFNAGVFHYWNGGLPAGLIALPDGSLRGKLASNRLPLGILPPEEFDARCDTLALERGSTLILFSDGLVEAVNTEGEALGEDRVIRALSRRGEGTLLEAVKKDAIAFLDGLEPLDDITLLTVSLE